MPANESTKLQVNFGSGPPLINVYADDEIELQQLLSGLRESVEAVTQTQELLKGVSNVQQVLGGVVVQQGAPQTAAPQQAAGGLPEPAAKEFCQHGQMVWKSGVAKGTGKPYGLWECMAGKPEQGGCGVRWPKRG